MTDYPVSELAYLAGMVDGDGSITLHMRAAGSLRLRLYVGNTNEALIHWLHEHFGGDISLNVHRGSGTWDATKHKQMHHWRIERDAAVELLSALIPFLLVKRAVAEVAIEAWGNRQPTDRSERTRPMRGEYVNRIHELNRKGA